MRFALLMYSHPEPWGHPTSEHLAEQRALPEAERARLNDAFDGALRELQERGELVGGGALGDPRSATLYRWEGPERRRYDGPYSDGPEHLAGYFVIDVPDLARAQEVATAFSGPGETVELRALA